MCDHSSSTFCPPDLGVDGGDVEVNGDDAGQHPGQQEPVMVIECAQPKPREPLPPVGGS
jgi:hypothetical protein